MRLRNIPGAREAILNSPYVVYEMQQQRGSWIRLFQNENPIHIEVGMGKGRFVMDMAKLSPNINYIGIEMYDSVLLRALQSMEEEEMHIPNLRFLRMDARELTLVFSPGEVAKIYLNFSDPWPKERHAKRRLTSRQFLKRYDQVLDTGGVVEFKTDNQKLFEFSLEEAKQAQWKIVNYTTDLHSDADSMETNVMTEYEEKFARMGNPIFKLIMQR